MPAYNQSAAAERPLLAQLMSVQGPIAREVRDVRLGLKVMSARDPHDPWWVPAPFEGPKLAQPLKVAIARIPSDMRVDPAVIMLARRAADYLSDAGYIVKEVEVPDLTEVWQLWADVLLSEIEILQEPGWAQVTSQDFKQVLRGYKGFSRRLDLKGYMTAIATRSHHLRAWLLFLEKWPLVVTPTTVQPTPGVRADLAGNRRVRELFRNDLRFTSAINVLGLPAAVVPVALHQDHPVGVQIIASRYREDLCLNAAQAIERRAGVLARLLWAREAR